MSKQQFCNNLSSENYLTINLANRKRGEKVNNPWGVFDFLKIFNNTKRCF